MSDAPKQNKSDVNIEGVRDSNVSVSVNQGGKHPPNNQNALILAVVAIVAIAAMMIFAISIRQPIEPSNLNNNNQPNNEKPPVFLVPKVSEQNTNSLISNTNQDFKQQEKENKKPAFANTKTYVVKSDSEEKKDKDKDKKSLKTPNVFKTPIQTRPKLKISPTPSPTPTDCSSTPQGCNGNKKENVNKE